MKNTRFNVRAIQMYICAVSLSIAASTFASAQENVNAEYIAKSEGNVRVLSENLKKRYPSTQFTNIKASAVNGLYEVTMGRNIGYVDLSGRYFFFGKLFDMQTQTDLTEQPMEAATKIDFKSLPLKDSIKIQKGNGKRVFAVFSDPDCPYCKQLESTLSRMTDYTMYVFLFPLDSLHPEARNRAESIWCSSNRAKAWQDYVLDSIKPETKTCENPISQNLKLGEKLGANGTPTLINADGVLTSGALPRAELESWLDSKSTSNAKVNK